MDTIGVWVGRIALGAVLTFPIWGCILIFIVMGKENIPQKQRHIIEGTIGFWIAILTILDAGAGIVFFIVGANAQALADHWRWFWSWGGWVILALAVGNAIAVCLSAAKDVHDVTVKEFIGFSSFFSIVGAVVVAIIWLAITVDSAVIALPIAPPQ